MLHVLVDRHNRLEEWLSIAHKRNPNQAPNYSKLCLSFCKCHIHKAFNVLMLCGFANGLHRLAFTCTPKTQCPSRLKNCPDSKLLCTSQLCLRYYEFLVSCVIWESSTLSSRVIVLTPCSFGTDCIGKFHTARFNFEHLSKANPYQFTRAYCSSAKMAAIVLLCGPSSRPTSGLIKGSWGTTCGISPSFHSTSLLKC